jgi:hypothetical protein
MTNRRPRPEFDGDDASKIGRRACRDLVTVFALKGSSQPEAAHDNVITALLLRFSMVFLRLDTHVDNVHGGRHFQPSTRISRFEDGHSDSRVRRMPSTSRTLSPKMLVIRLGAIRAIVPEATEASTYARRASRWMAVVVFPPLSRLLPVAFTELSTRTCLP